MYYHQPAFFLFFFLVAVLPLAAQRSTPTELQIDNLYSGEAVQSFDLRPRTLEGSLYLREDTLSAAVLLTNGKVLKGFPVRLNLEADLLEVFSADGQVYVLPGAMVREFTLEEPGAAAGAALRLRFVRTSRLPGGEQFPGVAFLGYPPQPVGEERLSASTGKPLHSEGLVLLTGPEVEILRPNYVPALDAGNINARAVRHERLFLYDGARLMQVPKSRKKAEDLLRELDPRTARLIDEWRLDVRRRDDLLRLLAGLL